MQRRQRARPVRAGFGTLSWSHCVNRVSVWSAARPVSAPGSLRAKQLLAEPCLTLLPRMTLRRAPTRSHGGASASGRDGGVTAAVCAGLEGRTRVRRLALGGLRRGGLLLAGHGGRLLACRRLGGEPEAVEHPELLEQGRDIIGLR